ncbi:hypothetical protein IQ249_09485 [Lusitaniella coriacea LEGE 07157]|uniref:Uncharacterized protein n=1 Tax=Lusitaniella coriacea LEGE 07157 TaxID=945747 RepID=A0A8J7DYM2_9CYAN|nr:hypothetical protein [Lusitaniella coriacea]MBE9116126.1 hypothetical protein [Lusitaniella coriacea LEGE 07157]
MAIIALKAWYVEQYEPISDIVKRPHDLRLSRNSLLKSGLRADFLDDSQDVETSPWFERYLGGEAVEFYIEGSGGYAVSNVDLISHEIYFTKQDLATFQEPTIFLSHQTEYRESSELLAEVLEEAIAEINARSRLPLTLIRAQRPSNDPLRLSSTQLRQIRKSLLFIADGTPVATIGDNRLLLSSNVCIEMGYALQNKRSGQILLAQMERLSGQLPFDLATHQQLSFKTATELRQTLPNLLETLLKRFKLFS